MKHIHRIFVITLFLMAASQWRVLGEAPADEICVDIRCQDKGIDQPATEYYGVMRKTDFAAIMTNDIKPGAFLRLSHVAWMEDGQITQLADANSKGTKFGFKNVMYVRMDTILRIVELDETFVGDHLRY